jgi:hypothetical protein
LLPLHRHAGAPMMGKPQRKHANNRAVGRMQKSILFFFSLLFAIVNINPTPQYSPTMAIATRSLINKEKPASRALVAIAPSPAECHQEQRSERLAKSPRATNVNSLLAEINRPSNCINNVLQALGPSKDPANGVDHSTPSDLTLLTDKTNQVTPLASPTGVDQEPPEALATNRETDVEDSPQARVRISDMTETVNADPSPAALPTTRGSILQPTLLGVSQSSNTSLSDNEASSNETHVKEVHNCSNMLFKVYSNNGMKATSYYVMDFAGLYPVWPIIEFWMAPTGEAKDDRMTSFIKCVVALFGEILYINNTAKIATISITKDESSYIGSKADLPTNFTKLGQYIMISGGSWVLNKKAKGSNNVYARFRLKSQVNTDEIMNRVSFKFSCLGGKNLQKKQHQAMETETPLMLLFVCNSTDQASIISDTKQMLDTALDNIKQNGMLPKEYKN